VTLRLGSREFADDVTLMMAIVNRTPDSFYDRGATWVEDEAFDRVAQVVDEGAEVVDIGGVKAGPGPEVDAAEEMRRVVGFVARVRAAYPTLVISVDTWRADVARAVCQEGADLVNDAWGGHDPALAEVVAQLGAALVCTHTGGAAPRSLPDRVEYADVMADVIASTTGQAERAVRLGVDPRSVLVDPAHDFGKNTYHSLEVTRRLDELAATGWPVLVAVSNKKFLGEVLDADKDHRLEATLATTALCAWLGGRVFRAHQVAATRRVLDTVAAIQGTALPAVSRRALA
jgi:dihydropteroate synthase